MRNSEAKTLLSAIYRDEWRGFLLQVSLPKF